MAVVNIGARKDTDLICILDVIREGQHQVVLPIRPNFVREDVRIGRRPLFPCLICRVRRRTGKVEMYQVRPTKRLEYTVPFIMIITGRPDALPRIFVRNGVVC